MVRKKKENEYVKLHVDYYLETLGKEQQKVYYAIKEGLTNIEKSFPVPRTEGKELSDIFQMVRMDCPEIFYTISFTYRFYPDSNYVEMIPEYLFPKDKIKEHKQALESRVRKIVRNAEQLNELEKELYVHDFICENVHYDKLKKQYSHEILGALGNGVAVCEGIAKAVKLLLNELGVWCIVVMSENNPEKGIKYRHAWNVVRINGEYFHLDVTFDNTISKENLRRYDYVNLSDKQILKDHEPLIWKAPICSNGNEFYYKVKKLSWTTLEEVQKRTKQAVKKGKSLVFHWRGGYITKDVVTDIFEIFSKEASSKEKHAYCSLNWQQAVITARFMEGKGEEQLEIEDANEGEKYEENQ